jgi:hypothetical protein
MVEDNFNQTWSSKLDRINNLQSSSDNAALHRSILPDDQNLIEKAWARSVPKYWSIDEAAMGEEYLESSSRGAAGSWGGSCDISPLRLCACEPSLRAPQMLQKLTPRASSVSTSLEHARPLEVPDYTRSIDIIKLLKEVIRYQGPQSSK